jgi:hypothetical protein
MLRQRRGVHLGCRQLCSVTAPTPAWKMVTEPEELADVTARVKNAWRVGIDTEFTDFPKLHPQLNLVQLVIDGDEFIVDPQATLLSNLFVFTAVVAHCKSHFSGVWQRSCNGATIHGGLRGAGGDRARAVGRFRDYLSVRKVQTKNKNSLQYSGEPQNPLN